MGFNDTDIRWTDRTHNAVHGCSKTSEGCANCYAERVSRRFGHTDQPWTVDNAESNVQLKPDFLDDSLGDPAWVFVNSMSDMFHEQVPDDFIHRYWDLCCEHPESAFQVLTKHGADQDRDVPHPPDNVMLGVSCESPRRRYRLDWLRGQPAATKFVSFEPLVECIPDADLSGIGWAIIGGESGPDRREMEPAWARTLIRACRRQDVAVFFKQHSGPQPESDVTIEWDGREQRLEEFPELPSGVLPRPQKHMQEKLVA
jgi:protein gp37